MAKFNVGVGDAFPVETESARTRDDDMREDDRRDDDRDRQDDWRGRRRRYQRFWYIKVSLVLLVIYGAIAIFSHSGLGPRGLLLAAAIVFGVGFVTSLFREDDRPRRRDRERRRPWGER
ncbi:MAG: hypothetical protein QM698_09245 [Micropepsaceae bacterium]